jgi:hypothetical protein
MLVGEERNIVSRTASFFCVGQSGTLWKGKNFGEPWWTGIETVHRGVLFLHGFATPDLPGRKGITAVDCTTGDMLWNKADLTFLAAEGDTVYSSHDAPDGPVVALIDHRTGAHVRDEGRGIDALRNVPRAGLASEDVQYPIVLSDDDLSPLSAIVRKHSSTAAAGRSVEYAEHGPFVVIVYYTENDTARAGATTYSQVLDIVDRDSGTRVMHETLDESVASPSFDTFLVQADTLYFVSDRKTLSAVELRS